MIPPHAQHYLSSIKLGFWDRLWRFIAITPLPFALNIVVYNPFFITCYDIFKEQLDRIAHLSLQLVPKNRNSLRLDQIFTVGLIFSFFVVIITMF